MSAEEDGKGLEGEEEARNSSSSSPASGQSQAKGTAAETMLKVRGGSC